MLRIFRIVMLCLLLLPVHVASAVARTSVVQQAVAQSPTSGAGQFVPLAVPQRMVDTGAAVGVPTRTPVPAQATTTVDFTGRSGVPATGVSAVAANVAVVGPTATGALPTWPAGETRPGVSTLIYYANVPYASSSATLKLNPQGESSFFNSSTGTVRIVVDVTGYYTDDTTTTAAHRFVPLRQSRILDTRNRTGVPTTTPVPANTAVTFAAATKGGLPAANLISAAVVNITSLGQTSYGGWTVHPAGVARPGVNHGFFVAGRAKTNSAIVKIAADGRLSLHNVSGGTSHYIVDVVGYYTPSTSPAAASMRVAPVSPRRVLDTGSTALVPAATARTVKVAGQAGVPATGVGLVALHVIVAGSSTSGEMVTYPPGQTRPSPASDVMPPGAQYSFNLVWARTNAAGEVTILNATNAGVRIYADVQAYSVVPRTPSQPTGVRAEARDGSAALSWTAPSDLGDLPLTRYQVTTLPGDATITSTTTSATVGGLTNGSEYQFRVVAINAAGASPPAALSEPVTPAPPAPPGKPYLTDLTARDQAAAVSWSAPPGPDTVVSYRVASGTATVTVPGTARTAILDGLTNGQAHQVTVTAINGNGSQASDPQSVTPRPAKVPLRPIINSVVPLNGRVDVQWVPPSDGGAPITGYLVTANPGTVSIEIPAGTTVAAVTGLTNGVSHTLTVRARNRAGLSEAAETTATPQEHRVPQAPGDVEVSVPSAGSVQVSWRAPEDAGTAPVSGYTVTASPGGRTATTSSTTATLSGLDPAVGYTIQVVATNQVGTGPASTSTAPVQPAVAVKKAPVVLTADSIRAISKMYGDGTIAVETPTSQLLAVVPGDILAAEPSTIAPAGFLKRVLRIDTNGGMRVLLTEDAPMSAVLSAGDIAGRWQLTDADLASFVPASAGVRIRAAEIGHRSLREGARRPATRSGDWTIGLRDGAFIVEVEKDFGGADIRMTASVKPHVHGKLGLGKGNTDFTLALDAGVEVYSHLTARGLHLERSIPLGEVRASCFTMPLGPLPATICPVLRVGLEISADGKAGMLVTAEFSRRVGARITHTDGQGLPNADGINEPLEDNALRITPSVSTNGEVELRTDLDLLYFGVAGPRIGVGLYLEGEVDVWREPWWEASVGVALGAGLHVDAFGFELNWEKEDVLNIEFQEWQASEPFLGVVIDPPRAEIPVGGSQQFSYQVPGWPDEPAIWSVVSGVGTISPTGLYSSNEAGAATVQVKVPGTTAHPEWVTTALIGVGGRPPDGVSNVTVTPGELSATVKWTPPSFSGGRPLTQYIVTTVPDTGASYVDADATAVRLTGLSSGTTYRAFVRPVTTAGQGDWVPSAPFTVRPLTVSAVGASDITTSLGTPGTGAELVGKDGSLLSASGRYAFFAVPGRSWVSAVPGLPDDGFTYLVRRDLLTGEAVLASRGPDGRTPQPVLASGYGAMVGQYATAKNGEIVAFRTRYTDGSGVTGDRVFVHNITARTTWGPSQLVRDVEMLRLNVTGDALAFSAGLRDGEFEPVNDVYYMRRGNSLLKVNQCIETNMCDAAHLNTLGISADGNTVIYRSIESENPSSPYYGAPNLIVLRNLSTGARTLPYAGRTKPVVNSATFSDDGGTILAIVAPCIETGCTSFTSGLAVKSLGVAFTPQDVLPIPVPAGRYLVPSIVSNGGGRVLYVSRRPRESAPAYSQFAHIYNRVERTTSAVPAPAGAEGDYADWFPALSANGSMVTWTRFKASNYAQRCVARCMGVQGMRVG